MFVRQKCKNDIIVVFYMLMHEKRLKVKFIYLFIFFF